MNPTNAVRVTFFLLLFCSSTILMGSSNSITDSLIQAIPKTDDVREKILTLDELSYLYRRIDLDSAMNFNAAGYEFCKDTTYRKYKARFDYNYGVLYRLKGEFDKSIQYYHKYLEYAEAQQSAFEIAKGYYGIAFTHSEARDYESSIEQAIIGKKYFQQCNDTLGEIRILNMIGMALNDSYRTEEAKNYLEKAISLAELIDDKNEAAHIYTNLANSYNTDKDYETALKYYFKVLAFDKSVNSKWGIGMSLHNIGKTYNSLGRFSSAEIELRKALKIKTDLKHTEEIAQVESDLGFALAHAGQYQKGVNMIESSLAKSIKNNWLTIIKQNYDQLASAHLVNGNYKKGSAYQKRYIAFTDSLAKIDMEFKVNALETKFATTEKEQKIALLDTENKLNALQLSVAKRRSLIYGITSIIFGGLLFLLYRLYRKINIQNSEKDILLREIHHRVKNNLQVISSLLRIQSRSIKDETAKKAIQEGRTRVHTMSLIHQNLYRKENVSGVSMKVYLAKLSRDLFETYNVSAGEISLKTNIEDIKLDVESVIPIGLIVNELLTNALKYAFPDSKDGEIKVSLIEKGKQLFLTVQDNGIGMETILTEEKSTSFGHSLIRAFKSKLDAVINIESNNGTKVELIINNYIKAA